MMDGNEETDGDLTVMLSEKQQRYQHSLAPACQLPSKTQHQVNHSLRSGVAEIRAFAVRAWMQGAIEGLGLCCS